MTTNSLDATIRPAAAADLENIERLLVASSLPLDGVQDALSTFVVAEQDGTLLGVTGVEECGEYGLLRSAAVDPAARNRGLGRRLVERAIGDAKAKKIRSLYLLTTTAERYFPAFGFEVIARDAVPDPIRGTAEFTTACPASATVMKLDLEA